MIKRTSIIITFILIYSFSFSQITTEDKNLQIQKYRALTDSIFNSDSFIYGYGFSKKTPTLVDTFICSRKGKCLKIIFDKELGDMPVRDIFLTFITEQYKGVTIDVFKSYKIKFYSNGKELSTLVPNYFRTNQSADNKRKISTCERKTLPIVTNISKPYSKSFLYNKNIALWHSHGWYYEHKLQRWEWQRACLYKTVEDLLPMTFTINFLLPMLENAGASVFLPRERSIQTNEVIVDNDDEQNSNGMFNVNAECQTITQGFANSKNYYSNENPFELGTTLKFKSKSEDNFVEYIPNIPQKGEYPVYVSYQTVKNSNTKVLYEVYHTGGVTQFNVNQTMGGGTWVYLGTFTFDKGINPDNGKVLVKTLSSKGSKYITTDAIRFGGGMGNIIRNEQISERPRYQEAARYYLQYSGYPDSLVWNATNDEYRDYVDDLHAHGDWVNYMSGCYYKKSKRWKKYKKIPKGLSIPIDLSLAVHTDAGIAQADTTIGTLAIYSTKKNKGLLPTGVSKMVSRDLCDMVQTQIVNDIRLKYYNKWSRRGLADKRYSEAYRPNVPAMLLELLSHQNFNDMQFAHNPQFQFDVSRAIYKGIAKFFAYQYKQRCIIQPLPINSFATDIVDNKTISLQWQPTIDTLEPTAKPTSYIVYTKIGEQGYDNGVLVKNNSYTIENVKQDVIYSFKITALNKGGESFPSEELSVCINSANSEKVLIVNAFDRLGGASYINESNKVGFTDIDEGVPYRYNFYTVGSQYDFNRASEWLDDDAPGCGASHSDRVNDIERGNTFDFSYIHGKAIQNAGYSFASVSDECLIDSNNHLNKYFALDILGGEERTMYPSKNDSVKCYELFTNELVNAVSAYVQNGGNVFISGSYIGSDALFNKQDSIVADILKYKVRTSNASKKGIVKFVNDTLNLKGQKYSFNTAYIPELYKAECVDAIEPIVGESSTFMRYAENNKSAGVIFKGKYSVVAIGFPFEVIKTEPQRNMLMNKVLEYFKK